MRRIKAIYSHIEAEASRVGIRHTERLPHKVRLLRRYVYPGLAKYSGDKLYGYTLRLDLLKGQELLSKGKGVKLSIVEWNAGRSHEICDVCIMAGDSEARLAQLSSRLIDAYLGLVGQVSWLEKV